MMEKIDIIIVQNKKILSHVKKSTEIDVGFKFDLPTKLNLKSSEN